MTGRFDNIHPELTCQHARQILLQPVNELDSQSDYYTAASHLINCPGSETEQSLLDLLESSQNNQAVKIAKRKAVEVLARLGATSLMSKIGQCLWSDDPYLVENTIYALKQLKCSEPDLIEKMLALLQENNHNQRVLIQCLSALSVDQLLPLLNKLRLDESPGVRGAAISAIAQLAGDTTQLSLIVSHLVLPNQMDRQCAIQDLIDAGSLDYLSSIVAAPVSPAFRLRAFRLLLTAQAVESDPELFLSLLDSLLIDDPDDVNIVHRYDCKPEIEFLIRDLFNTDFSRCYLAMKDLRETPAELLWPVILKAWEDEAHNDYGAHYFFMRLLGSRSDWPDHSIRSILDILENAAVNRRPQFQKSRSAALLSLSRLNPSRFWQLIPSLLDPASNPPWDCRYVVILASESISNGVSATQVADVLELLNDDADDFVRARLAFKNRFE